jgi:DNA-binding transcriptional LysR family regulator
MKQVDWSDLQYFFAVAEAGTLSAAANRVGASQATIWRRIRALEQSLGVSLFDEKRSGHVLSPAGLEVMALVAEMDKDVNGLTAQLLSKHLELEGEVRVTAPEFLGFSLIAPRLPELLKAHPRLSMELLLGSPSVTLFDRQTDIALLFEPGAQDRFRLQGSFPIPFGVYAAQQYIHKYGAPSSLADIGKHKVVDFEPFAGHIAPAAWSGRIKSATPIVFRSNSPHARVAAIVAGVGLGVLPTSLAQQSPKLKCLIGPDQVGHLNLLMLVNKGVARDPRVKAIVAFLADLLDDHVSSYKAMLEK